MENSFKTIREGILSGELKQKDRQLAVVPEPWTTHHVVQSAIWTRINPFVAHFRGRKRPHVLNEVLFNNSHGRIYFSGEILDTADEEVWLQIVKMSGKKLFQSETSVKIRFNGYDFLKTIRKDPGGSNLKWLWSSLKRLEHGSFEMLSKRKRFMGSFINWVELDEETGEFVVSINENLGKSYLNFAYTQINFNERFRLKGGMAKKLHSFLSSQKNHENGYKYTLTVVEAREITGSEACEKKFRDTLKSILDQFLTIGFLKFAQKINQNTWDLRLSNL